jgi:hypothetical protein
MPKKVGNSSFCVLNELIHVLFCADKTLNTTRCNYIAKIRPYL